MFEPFSMRKSIVYMVVVPAAVSSDSNLLLPLKKYFRELSITFKVHTCLFSLSVCLGVCVCGCFSPRS